MVAAHPDDEKHPAHHLLARARGYRTAYSPSHRATGQNVLGPNSRRLGLIRTRSCWQPGGSTAASKIFHHRARDFGFSKSAEETLKIWTGKPSWAMSSGSSATFQPDVIHHRFSPTQTNTARTSHRFGDPRSRSLQIGRR